MIRKIARRLILLVLLLSITHVAVVNAAWYYAKQEIMPTEADCYIALYKFEYDAEEMPEGEASLLERVGQILNNEYVTDKVTNSREYLLDYTIRRSWSGDDYYYYDGRYVGSMDGLYANEIDALFGDIMDDAGVKFILKNEDLTYDGQNEIALYSTSDPLDWVPGHYGIVGVYLSVYTPIIDNQGNVLRYELLCSSIHGYCLEVNYQEDDTQTPSFSTDEWKDELSYWHHEEPYLRPMPADARYTYENYHTHHYSYPGCYYPSWLEWTGKTAEQRIAEILWG